MMFDTGAETPVWCKEEEKLLRFYPDVIKKDEKCFLSGFGKGYVEANVFVIPDFSLQVEDNCYRVKNLQIIQSVRPDIGCDFILSDTVFSNVDTLIYRNRKRHLDICYYKDQYYCTPMYADAERFRITVWPQSE